ncbi:fatty acid desaturase [uncultured Tenacibaculum sp.]|uniref:fatty acid desaturase family protein n=1 Tax=uncultured Tenacibaculum sp. TaxID=174713 RepID=UPI002612743B|nr:fatty acid desaturase [uncultured Tenacibaculum sp.]
MENPKFISSTKEKQFFTTLREKVFYQLGYNNSKFGDFNFWAKGIFWCFVSYFSYSALFFTHSHLAFWCFFLMFQISGLLIGFSFGHDASHNTAFRNKDANQVLHFFCFLTVGIDPLLWGLRHIRSHHLYANVEGSDIDIDKNPFLRLAPSHPWSKKHKYQHIYAPFVYMLALLHSVFMGDWIYLFSKEYSWMREGVSKNQLYIRFFLFKILYFSLVLFIPFAYSNVSFQFVTLTYITTSAFTSLLFVVMLVGTHFFLEASYYECENNELNSSWAIHQLKTSCDWNPNSKFARFLSGGSNCHAAHHLFPNICHTNYDKINSIIEETTKEYGYPYHKKTLLNMMISHFKHLKKMGENS